MAGCRLLLVREASSALAAVSAVGLLWLMKLFDWIWPLSRPLTAEACAARKAWVTTRFVVTNWPFGHRLASLTRAWPPGASISPPVGAGSQPPAIWPDWKASTASEFGVIGVMWTSPPPVWVVVRPC